MKKIDWKGITKHRTLGLLTMALGVAVLFAPIVVGTWIIAILGLVFLAAGLIQFLFVLRSPDRFASFIPYFSGGICVVLGCVLFLSPSIALTGIMVILSATFLIDGCFRLYSAAKLTGPDRWWTVANGVFTIFLGFLVWALASARIGFAAIGIVLGLWLLFEGWTMFLMPERVAGDDLALDFNEHPDPSLGLPHSDLVRELQEPIIQHRAVESSHSIFYSVTFIVLFFVIHILRTSADWSILGLISPFAAVIGDVIVALLLGLVILLPLRLLWRRLTRSVERVAWFRLQRLSEGREDPTILERGIRYWLGLRMRFALELRDMRYSLNFAFWRLLRYGLPLVAVLIAINSIWGFSWYFNSENWASAVWQEITKNRIDAWRQRAAVDAEAHAVASGITRDKVFAIDPEGVGPEGDFSFIVIGDTGEGDPSQAVLRDQLIAAGKRDDVKFLVVSSDVVYPDGKMKDYESKFYLPFKGFEKPIYAIPGNHDWFDANEGFNANFLEPDSALISLRARLYEDLQTDLISSDPKFNALTSEAKRLRDYYRIRNGSQRGPFFEMHTPGFSLIALDTGILRRIDDKQMAWFEESLIKAGDNYKLVILGHPFYVAGRYVGLNEEFRQIHELMKRYKVNASMAGDTHDFEHYREIYDSGTGPSEMFHFVNGGGGAYLSVGTAVAFPDDPDTADYAFYPRSDDVNRKLENETPFWKRPFLIWMRTLGGWPFDSEVVSGAFDFNSAPFFQSFVEVRVERSRNRVSFLVHGVNGPLRWREIQTSPGMTPDGSLPDDLVEFNATIAK